MQYGTHPLLSAADKFATASADMLILIARILLAWVFLAVAYGAITNFAGSLGYFTSLKVSSPELFTGSGSFGRIVDIGQLDTRHGHALRRNSRNRVCGCRYCARASLLGISRWPAADRSIQQLLEEYLDYWGRSCDFRYWWWALLHRSRATKIVPASVPTLPDPPPEECPASARINCTIRDP